MKNASRLRKGRDPEAEGRRRHDSVYGVFAILILMALSCVVLGTCRVLGPPRLGRLSPVLEEEAQLDKSISGMASETLPGFRVAAERVQARNMAPGDQVTAHVDLQNLGPVPLRVVVTARVVSDNGLCEALVASLFLAGDNSSEGSYLIYQGPLTELRYKPSSGLPLSAQSSERVTWSVYFPFESGNEYQAVQCQVDLLFEAQ